MNRLVVSSLLGGALLLSGAAGASPNLVADPGFESGGFSGWTVVGNLGSDVGVDQVFLDVNSGSFGAYLGNADTSTLSQDVATVAGAQYEVSFYLDVYQSTAYDGFFTVSFGGQSVASLVEPAETDSFVRYSAIVTAGGPTSRLLVSASDPGGYYGLDDLGVVQASAPVPEPATLPLALGGLGLLGLDAWRRRRAARGRSRAR